MHDIPHSVLHVDKGFPYTFLQLIKRPAKAMEEYLAGKRVNYNRPLAYVIMMSAIGALVATQVQKLIRELHFKRTGETLLEHQTIKSCYFPWLHQVYIGSQLSFFFTVISIKLSADFPGSSRSL